jgi:hypothetical protein
LPQGKAPFHPGADPIWEFPGFVLLPDVPRPENKGCCHRGAGVSGIFFEKIAPQSRHAIPAPFCFLFFGPKFTLMRLGR